MLALGDLVEVYGKKAIVLSVDEKEVLVFFGQNAVKWVDRDLVDDFRVA